MKDISFNHIIFIVQINSIPDEEGGLGADLWVQSTAETHKFRSGAESGGKHHFPHFVAKVSAQTSESYNG